MPFNRQFSIMLDGIAIPKSTVDYYPVQKYQMLPAHTMKLKISVFAVLPFWRCL